ncbi:MAG: hypothetical protein ACREBQ_05140, partial [Nitrososphaerales archaeon]
MRARPILCILLLSPGIPEYLSGSSPIDAIILNPFQFIFQLLANLGLYGPGVLLIREAMIRWEKGWGSVLLLGAAYGILEEGIALSTLFNPNANPVGELGRFGHWLGVNWVWVAGILSVHMIFSISLPILLLGLALPETRGKSLLSSRRKINTTFTILGFDVSSLFLLVLLGERFWMGWSVFLSSFLAIGALVYLAHRVPANILRGRSEVPKRSPAMMAVIGAMFYPAVLLTEFTGIDVGLPAILVVGLVVTVQALFLICVLTTMGRSANERQLISLALGLVLPIALFGVASQIGLPIVLLADLGMVIFLWKLLK